MKRSFKLLAVVAIVGLLMLATTATVFAEHPDNPDGPPVPKNAHHVSCEGQRGAIDNATSNGPSQVPPEDLVNAQEAKWQAACNTPA